MSSIPPEHLERYFFHFTHIDNLDSIIQNGLLSTNEKAIGGITHFNIAAAGIQERRSAMNVTCGCKGVVHDYVPFYFCYRNPMFLSMLYTKNVDQPLILIFAIKIDKILEEGVVFTDASANTKTPPNFYEDPADLKELDWKTIDGLSWKCANDDEKHRRMAEVLIYKEVPIEDVAYIIVWNDTIKKMVTDVFTKNLVAVPKFAFAPFKTKYKFHFTKFMFKNRDGESLITGPRSLKSRYESTVNEIIEKRSRLDTATEFQFSNIADCLATLKTNFSAIPEMAGIFELETTNPVHPETVSDHTISVLDHLKTSEYYKDADREDKRILKLTAYLHDIGKGPKSMWKGGKQDVYPDHPADAPRMLKRILVEEIAELSEYQIRMICLLVTYHDLIGEIFEHGRDERQLIDIIDSEKDFDMLSTLNEADVTAINRHWGIKYSRKIDTFKKDIMKKTGI